MKPPTLPAPTELVIVRPGSPETAGTRYLGLCEALDRARGAVLRGMVTRRRTMAERESGLIAARDRALLAACDNGFAWRPREYVRKASRPAAAAAAKPTFAPRLRF